MEKSNTADSHAEDSNLKARTLITRLTFDLATFFRLLFDSAVDTPTAQITTERVKIVSGFNFMG
jgi:hypothetical protein